MNIHGRMIAVKVYRFSQKMRASNRYVSTTGNSNISSLELKSARPFSEIPGPRGLPIFGNIFRYIPGIGEYGGLNIFPMMKQLRADYGDIVRFEGLPSCRPCVLLFDVNAIKHMYRTEGRQPSRILLESVHRYVQNNLTKDQVPLFTRQGDSWKNSRSLVNQYIRKPGAIYDYISQIDQVSEDFVKHIHRIRDPLNFTLPKNFMIDVTKLMLEYNFKVVLDKRAGFFDPNSTTNSDALRLLEANTDFLENVYHLDLRPSLSRYYETRNLKRFYKKLETIFEVTTNQIREGIEQIKNKPESNSENVSMLERVLQKDEAAALVVLRDALIEGIDVTANAIGKALYLISTHPEIQEKLKAELDVALPQIDSPFIQHTTKQIPFLRACIKETLRVYPPDFGTLRTLNEDTAMAGYKIPKGMDLIAVHGILSGDEKQFPDPEKFIPERWLRNGDPTACPAESANKFSYMPFSFGPRSCSGKNLANTYMEVIISKIVKRFHLEWHNEPLEEANHMINAIRSPLQLTILDR